MTVPRPVRLLALFLILGTPGLVFSQSEAVATAPEPGLPRTFRGLSLGMALEELKTALAQDDLFYFRGDRDVSLLPAQEQTLVETSGFSFVRRAFFQLYEGKVFIMAFDLDSAKIDHYSVFSAFTEKYGPSSALDPQQAVWTSADTRVSIERPLTVKYIDQAVFDRIMGASRVKESREAVLRQEFLRDF